MSFASPDAPGGPGRFLPLALVVAVFLLLMGGVIAVIYWPRDEPDFPREGSVGEQVTDGWLVYRVRAVRCGISSAPGEPRDTPEQGQYCEVRLEVFNPEDSGSNWNARLRAKGSTYGVHLYLSGPDGVPRTLGAGEHRTEVLLFDVPKASPDTLELWVYDDSTAVVHL